MNVLDLYIFTWNYFLVSSSCPESLQLHNIVVCEYFMYVFSGNFRGRPIFRMNLRHVSTPGGPNHPNDGFGNQGVISAHFTMMHMAGILLSSNLFINYVSPHLLRMIRPLTAASDSRAEPDVGFTGQRETF